MTDSSSREYNHIKDMLDPVLLPKTLYFLVLLPH